MLLYQPATPFPVVLLGIGESIKKLTIEGYKSIQKLEDLELRALNVMIGANGAEICDSYPLPFVADPRNFHCKCTGRQDLRTHSRTRPLRTICYKVLWSGNTTAKSP